MANAASHGWVGHGRPASAPPMPVVYQASPPPREPQPGTTPVGRSMPPHASGFVGVGLRPAGGRLAGTRTWGGPGAAAPALQKLGEYGLYAINLHDEQIEAELNAAAELAL
jgi:hypothetical protein